MTQPRPIDYARPSTGPGRQPSWMAMAAIPVGLISFPFLPHMLYAYWAGPLPEALENPLSGLLMPLLGMVFCIAAMIHVRRSDGRRSGEFPADIGFVLAFIWLGLAIKSLFDSFYI